MTTQYHTLLVSYTEPGQKKDWCIEFGGNDREFVMSEREGYGGWPTKIITTAPDQLQINLAVMELNGRIAV